MEQISANGKCVVCGNPLASKYQSIDIDGVTPIEIIAHPWCKRGMDTGKKKPIAFWHSIGCHNK